MFFLFDSYNVIKCDLTQSFDDNNDDMSAMIFCVCARCVIT